MYSIRYSSIVFIFVLNWVYIRYIKGRKAMKWRGGRIGRGEALQVDRERVGDTGGEKGG